MDSAQEREQKLLQHNKLKRQVSSLTTKLNTLRKSSGKHGRKKTVDPLLQHDKLLIWGKKYVVTVNPWPQPSMFMAAPTPNAPMPNSSKRSANFETFQAGALLELQEYLSSEPELQEQARSYGPFRDAVGLLTWLYQCFLIFL